MIAEDKFDLIHYKLSLVNRFLSLRDTAWNDAIIPDPIWKEMGVVDANDAIFSSFEDVFSSAENAVGL
jgi:hypothetical protein